MDIKKLEEGIILKKTIEEHKGCIDTITQVLKDYNIASDIKFKIKGIFNEKISELSIKFEEL